MIYGACSWAVNIIALCTIRCFVVAILFFFLAKMKNFVRHCCRKPRALYTICDFSRETYWLWLSFPTFVKEFPHGLSCWHGSVHPGSDWVFPFSGSIVAARCNKTISIGALLQNANLFTSQKQDTCRLLSEKKNPRNACHYHFSGFEVLTCARRSGGCIAFENNRALFQM